jgi:hypothetical protein
LEILLFQVIQNGSFVLRNLFSFLAFHDVSDRQWTPMMESAFDVIFKLADGPIKHIENIIKKLAVKTGVKLGGLFKIPTSSQSQSVFVEPMDFESENLLIFFS